MKKNRILLIFILALYGILGSCRKDFLDVKPAGNLNQFVLANEKGINALLVGAYSMLDGVSYQFGWGAASSNWLYGSIRGLEANKGTDAGDPSYINSIQTFSETAENDYLNDKWRSVYEAISRCNTTIMVINQALTDGNINQTQADLFLKQARALRGWYHFEAWRMWEKIPYVDETTDPATVTNKADIRAKIISDLTAGTTLPNYMGAVGRCAYEY
jgi:hypothetical protein